MIKGIKNYFSFFGMMVATVNTTLAKELSRQSTRTTLHRQLLAKLTLLCELSPQLQNSKIHRRLYASNTPLTTGLYPTTYLKPLCYNNPKYYRYKQPS